MSHERGDLPPGAADWKAPGGEQSETKVEEEKPFYEDPKENQLFQEDIPVGERVYVDPGTTHNFRDQKTGEMESRHVWPGADFKKVGRRFVINEDAGMALVVDSKGNPFLTSATQDHVSALKRAGYEKGGMSDSFPYSRKGEDMGEIGAQVEKLQEIKSVGEREAERFREEARKKGGKF